MTKNKNTKRSVEFKFKETQTTRIVSLITFNHVDQVSYTKMSELESFNQMKSR